MEEEEKKKRNHLPEIRRKNTHPHTTGERKNVERGNKRTLLGY
jgi:hypothetical protein